ncbi:MAG: hypothetical protein IJ049_00245 [Oscillospiraceae bacterium]|nr:hypothetical protein [Oscillospiraceae bacterium]
MKKMKKMAALLLALVMLASILTACGKSSDTKTEEPTESTDTVIDPTVPEADAPDEVEAPAEEPQEESEPEEAGPVNILESPQVVFDQEGVQVTLVSASEDADSYLLDVKCVNNNPDNKMFRVEIWPFPNGYNNQNESSFKVELYSGDETEQTYVFDKNSVRGGSRSDTIDAYKAAKSELFTSQPLQMVRVKCVAEYRPNPSSNDGLEKYTGYAEILGKNFDEYQFYGETLGEIEPDTLEAQNERNRRDGWGEVFDGSFPNIKVYMKEYENFYTITIRNPIPANEDEAVYTLDGLDVTINEMHAGIGHFYSNTGRGGGDLVQFFSKEELSEDNVRRLYQIPNDEEVEIDVEIQFNTPGVMDAGIVKIDPYNKQMTFVSTLLW